MSVEKKIRIPAVQETWVKENTDPLKRNKKPSFTELIVNLLNTCIAHQAGKVVDAQDWHKSHVIKTQQKITFTEFGDEGPETITKNLVVHQLSNDDVTYFKEVFDTFIASKLKTPKPQPPIKRGERLAIPPTISPKDISNGMLLKLMHKYKLRTLSQTDAAKILQQEGKSRIEEEEDNPPSSKPPPPPPNNTDEAGEEEEDDEEEDANEDDEEEIDEDTNEDQEGDAGNSLPDTHKQAETSQNKKDGRCIFPRSEEKAHHLKALREKHAEPLEKDHITPIPKTHEDSSPIPKVEEEEVIPLDPFMDGCVQVFSAFGTREVRETVHLSDDEKELRAYICPRCPKHDNCSK